MPEISKPQIATYWTAYDNLGGILHYGLTLPDQVTATGLASLDAAENEIDHLGNIASHVALLEPMPPQGTPLEAGHIYASNNIAYMVRQSHDRTEHNPADVPNLFFRHRTDIDANEWIPNEWVGAGAVRTYGGTSYKIIIPHQTQVGYEPPNVPNLWEPVIVPLTLWQSGESVEAGWIREHEGIQYRALIDHVTHVGWLPNITVGIVWELV